MVQKDDDNLMVMVPRSGEVVTISGVGVELWQALQTPCSVDELVAMLVKQYQINTSQARKDVTAFIDICSQHNLLKSV